jgi:hypothetical protein
VKFLAFTLDIPSKLTDNLKLSHSLHLLNYFPTHKLDNGLALPLVDTVCFWKVPFILAMAFLLNGLLLIKDKDFSRSMQLASSPLHIMLNGSWNSVLGIVTSCGLHGLGIEFWWGQDFLLPSRQPSGLHTLLHHGYQVFFCSEVAVVSC